MKISMPGMMDTVLNLGLNDNVVSGLAKKSGERFAYDSYRRFLDMFGNVVSRVLVYIFSKSWIALWTFCLGLQVMGISHSLFEDKLENLKIAKGASVDTELTSNDLKELVVQYKQVYLEAIQEPFPSGFSL